MLGASVLSKVLAGCKSLRWDPTLGCSRFSFSRCKLGLAQTGHTAALYHGKLSISWNLCFLIYKMAKPIAVSSWSSDEINYYVAYKSTAYSRPTGQGTPWAGAAVLIICLCSCQGFFSGVLNLNISTMFWNELCESRACGERLRMMILGLRERGLIATRKRGETFS